MMRIAPTGHGWIEMVTGPMYAGKSSELVRRLSRAIIAGQSVLAFKPHIDDRYHATAIASHNGDTSEAIAVKSSREVLERFQQIAAQRRADMARMPLSDAVRRSYRSPVGVDVVAIDEAQFFDDGIIGVCDQMADQGCHVLVASLDLDFARRPFGPVPGLLARAEFVDKLQAVCPRCGGPASFTQRLDAQGLPVAADAPIVEVGAQESYEPRCRSCHVIAPPVSASFPAASPVIEVV